MIHGDEDHRPREVGLPSLIRSGFLTGDYLVKVMVLAVAYALTGGFGLLLAIPPGYATAVWPSSGLALAGVLWWGPRHWLGIWLGSFLVNVWAAQSSSMGITVAGLKVAAGIAVGSTLQALLGGFMLQRWLGVARLFEQGQTILAFAGIEALSCLLAPTWGVGILCLAELLPWSAYFDSWRIWWLGDLIGVLIVTPVLLTWRQLFIDLRSWRLFETIGSLALFVSITVVVFAGPSPLGGDQYPLAFIPLPCLVWIAFRFRPGGVALATLLLSIIAVGATSFGFGPFVRDTSSESLLLLQTFTGLATMTGLTLSAAVSGHKLAEGRLRRLNAELEERVRERTTELEELTRLLEAQSLTDVLTGVANRRAFDRKFDEELHLAQRFQKPLSLVLLDADNFKTYNDAFGHLAGDEVLRQLGVLLTEVCRGSDFVARYGGEEFAVLLSHTDREEAVFAAERIRQAIETASWRHRAITVSIGIATVAPLGESATGLIAAADKALYEAKRAGRNRAVHASQESL